MRLARKLSFASVRTSGRIPTDLKCLFEQPLGFPLEAKVDAFKIDIARCLPSDGRRTVFATEWMTTDNVFMDLMQKHFPEILKGMSLVAIDTLHLFPETHACAHRVQDRYEKAAIWKKPDGVETLEEFNQLYGDYESLDQTEYNYVSMVEPFERAMIECQQDILITGRRRDQADHVNDLAVWEEGQRTLNPLAHWKLSDILEYSDKYDVPVNRGHNYVFRCHEPIQVTKRNSTDLPWTKHDLGKPYWQASESELKGEASDAVTYVYKCFGDMHTTVPVALEENEKTGHLLAQPKHWNIGSLFNPRLFSLGST